MVEISAGDGDHLDAQQIQSGSAKLLALALGTPLLAFPAGHGRYPCSDACRAAADAHSRPVLHCPGGCSRVGTRGNVTVTANGSERAGAKLSWIQSVSAGQLARR